MRARRLVPAPVLALLPGLLLPLLPVAPAAPAVAGSTTVPGQLSTNAVPGVPGSAGTGGSPGAVSGSSLARRAGPLAVTVPTGIRPKAITGVLTMPSVVAGATVALLVNGREVKRVPSALYQKVRVPVSDADVVAGQTIGLSVRYRGPAAAGCDPGPGVTLRSLGLRYRGTETPPVSPEAYLPPVAARVDVRIAPDAPDDVVEAALDAVTALGHRYGAQTPVVLGRTDAPLPPAGAGRRVVDVVAGDGPGATSSLTTVEGVPVLVLTGSGPELAAAARALSVRPAAVPALTRTLSEIEADAVPGAPDPVGSTLVEVRQDGFGSAVDSYRVHLVGTHTAVPPGSGARLDVYVDDQLVGSQVLDPAGTTVDLTADVPAAALRPTNQLRATLVPLGVAEQACTTGSPLGLTLDPDASTVTATRGVGELRGLSLLPEVLGDGIDVALAATGSRIDEAVDAAALLLAMQRLAVAPLDVTVVDPDELVDRQVSGLLVGADAATAAAVDAPVSLAGDDKVAALQSVVRDGHHLLVLGSWQPGDQPARPSLSHRLTSRVVDDGWARLTGDALVADASGPPYDVDSGRPATGPVPEQTAPGAPERAADDQPAPDERRLLWLGAAIALLVLALGLQLTRTSRRRR